MRSKIDVPTVEEKDKLDRNLSLNPYQSFWFCYNFSAFLYFIYIFIIAVKNSLMGADNGSKRNFKE